MEEKMVITMFDGQRQETYLTALLMDKDKRFDQMKQDSQRTFDEFVRANEERGNRERFAIWLANAVNFVQVLLLIMLMHKFG